MAHHSVNQVGYGGVAQVSLQVSPCPYGLDRHPQDNGVGLDAPRAAFYRLNGGSILGDQNPEPAWPGLLSKRPVGEASFVSSGLYRSSFQPTDVGRFHFTSSVSVGQKNQIGTDLCFFSVTMSVRERKTLETGEAARRGACSVLQ